MKLGSLFAGIGAFDMGVCAAVDVETAWQVEVEPFPRGVLSRRFPDAEQLGDIRECEGMPKVDLMVGGFPCQDLSAAGRGAGITGARSGLWGEYARLIREGEPETVLIENVPLLLRRGFDVVVADLVDAGYSVEWDCIPACAVGAPHVRDRVWIVARRGGHSPTVFGEAAALFPHPPAFGEGEDGWARWPRAGFVAADSVDVLELEPIALVRDVRRAADLWLTPTADPWASGGGGGELQAQVNREAAQFFPTPKTSDANWPSRREVAEGNSRGRLVTEVRIWPTPTAWLGRRPSNATGDVERAANPERSVETSDAVAVSGNPGPLNPDWVEWLMGLPVGWTEPDVDPAPFVGWHCEPVPRTMEGVANRGRRLTACGNALVRQVATVVAERVFRPDRHDSEDAEATTMS